MSKNIVGNTKQRVQSNVETTVAAAKDAGRLSENASLVIVAGYAFWSGYNHQFAVDWFSWVVMGAAIIVGLIAADTFLGRYRKEK